MSYPIQLSMFDYSKQYFLPVQALRDPAMDFVLNMESLYELLEADSETNGLSKTILFMEEQDRLMNTAEIRGGDGKQQIQISLNFCQFVWTVGLYMITYFDNCVQIPFMNAMGCNIHNRKVNPMEISFANDSFMRARFMLSRLNRESFFEIPNICDPQIFQEVIGHANGCFHGSLAMLFAHEFSHNLLAHTQHQSTPEQSVEEEKEADKMAISLLSDALEGDNGYTVKAGIAILMCSLLLLGEDSIDGGAAHPFMDVRIDYVMNDLDLPQEDQLWGLVGSAIRLWLLVYGGYSIQEDMQVKTPWNYYKDFYDYYMHKLTEVREKRCAPICKQPWDID